MMSQSFFSTKRVIRMSETDATGALYFTNLLKFATEAFEEFLGPLNSKNYLLPIVSAKASYSAPIFLGDEIVLKLSVVRFGNSSIELYTSVEKEGAAVGTVEIIHVVTSLETKKKIFIPIELKTRLATYSP
jgi:acyl-CoA thioesterase FadM